MRITPEDYDLLLRRQNPPSTAKARRVVRPWTSADDARLRELYPRNGAKKMAEVLNRGIGAVRDRCMLLGLNEKVRPWSGAEIDAMCEAYTRTPPNLAELAARIGRDEGNICRKARSLGLTDPRRKKVLKRKKRRMFDSADERRAHMSTIRRGRPNARKGKPGTPHTAESRVKISVASRRAWADPASGLNSDSAAQKRSDLLMARLAAGEMRERYSRSAGGRRGDLGNTYFRSSWEANYARYLNLLLKDGQIVAWAYEPRTFTFDKIKRGTRAYTPDFRIELGGRHEWHEVKGWMDHKSATRLKRMAKYYPAEKVVTIDKEWFRLAVRNGVAGAIPGWERRGVRRAP